MIVSTFTGKSIGFGFFKALRQTIKFNKIGKSEGHLPYFLNIDQPHLTKIVR
jgi:hypothetical protein